MREGHRIVCSLYLEFLMLDPQKVQGLQTRLVKSLHSLRAWSLAFQIGACFCRRCALIASEDIRTPQKAQCWRLRMISRKPVRPSQVESYLKVALGPRYWP